MRLRRWLYRGLYKIKGADPYRYISEVEDMAEWDRGDLQEWQELRLNELLEHAWKNVPYYRRVMESCGVGRDHRVSLDAIASLPVLTRRSVRDNSEVLKARDRWRNTVKRSTSGSTGSPLTIIRDSLQNNWTQAAKLRAYRWYGCELDDPVIVFTGTSKVLRTRLLHYGLDKLLNRLRVSVFDQSDAQMARVAARIARGKYRIIAGYPSAIYSFCRYCERNDLDLAHVGIKLVVPTAEMLSDYQKDLIERVFNAPVMNEYGCMETGGFAYSCPEKNLHVMSETVYLEITDSEGKRCADGEVGHVTATPIMARAMPLIRYQNGDLASITHEPCACGFQSGMPILRSIQGREMDVIRTRSGKVVHASIISSASKAALSNGIVNEYQVEQKDLDTLVIKYIPGVHCTETAVKQFASIISREISEPISIQLQEVKKIRRTAAGKFSYFVSKIE